MAKNFNELRAKMSPESRARARAQADKDLAEIRAAESPFEKYRGIGTPGIPSGRKAVIKWLRDLRGH